MSSVLAVKSDVIGINSSRILSEIGKIDTILPFLKEVHALPFYKKRSYRKRPIKYFNHKKQQPIESFKIRNDFLVTTEK